MSSIARAKGPCQGDQLLARASTLYHELIAAPVQLVVAETSNCTSLCRVIPGGLRPGKRRNLQAAE
jgi:hypothetical protein